MAFFCSMTATQMSSRSSEVIVMLHPTFKARLPAAVSGNEPALTPEKTAELVNDETLLIFSNQKLACPNRAGRAGSINYFCSEQG